MKLFSRKLDITTWELPDEGKITYSINQNGTLAIRMGLETEDTLLMLSPDETRKLREFLDSVKLPGERRS